MRILINSHSIDVPTWHLTTLAAHKLQRKWFDAGKFNEMPLENQLRYLGVKTYHPRAYDTMIDLHNILTPGSFAHYQLTKKQGEGKPRITHLSVETIGGYFFVGERGIVLDLTITPKESESKTPDAAIITCKPIIPTKHDVYIFERNFKSGTIYDNTLQVNTGPLVLSNPLEAKYDLTQGKFEHNLEVVARLPTLSVGVTSKYLNPDSITLLFSTLRKREVAAEKATRR